MNKKYKICQNMNEVYFMWKKILLIFAVLITCIIGIYIINFMKNRNLQTENDTDIENETRISKQYVTDECIDEWEDYALSKEILDVSKILSDESRIYILKSENSIINIYYINERNEEILYKTTDISTKYLSEEDIKELEEGIEVKGIQELNKKLEDFE